MAASQEQKVDYLLKKLGYSSSKTGIAEDESNLTGTKKAPFAEPIPSPLVVSSSNVWTFADKIPTDPSTADSFYVQEYPASSSGLQLTEDNTVADSRTFLCRTTYNDNTSDMLGDWIDTSYGADYIIEVYKGDPDSGGVKLPAAGSGSNDTWFFDYASGVLNFNGDAVPSGVTSSNIYVVGYRYVGPKGIGDSQVTNVLYVTKDGRDANSGKRVSDAKATIKAAVSAASTIAGSIVKVSSGTYVEDNPIKCGPQISVVGDSLREVTVVPNNAGEDLFHVAPGDYFTEMSFTGTQNAGKAIFAFDPDTIRYSSQSPYLRNCTNFVTNSIGMKIDGNHAIGPFKSFVTDSFTQYNQNGIGVSITNEGYAQIVSLFTINNDEGIYCGSGGQCDVTNSNSSFGNFGLVADGIGAKQFTGIISAASAENADKFTINVEQDSPTLGIETAHYSHTSGIITVTTSSNHGFNVGAAVTMSGLEFSCTSGAGTTTTFPDGTNGYIFTVNAIGAANSFSAYVGASTIPHSYMTGGTVAINVVRPFDGQVVYFDELYNTVGKITITNPGSGYSSPPEITISNPSTVNDWGIRATASATLSGTQVGEVNILSNGRGYTSTPTILFSMPQSGINSATATIELLPTYYTVKESTPISSGISTVTFNQNLPYSVGIGTTVPFYKQSRILASSHSFEYIGSGTDPISSLPSRGGVAIQENEVDNRNGGLVIYTSTDQGGNFRIGEGVVIDQVTGTISGNFYSKSLFANVTPLILALGGE